jgi:hypothetical protein
VALKFKIRVDLRRFNIRVDLRLVNIRVDLRRIDMLYIGPASSLVWPLAGSHVPVLSCLLFDLSGLYVDNKSRG